MAGIYTIIAQILLVGCLGLFSSCSIQGGDKQKPMQLESVEQAVQLIKEHKTGPEDFQLPIPINRQLTLREQEVPNDVAMVIITDQVLDKGWMPAGFEEKEGMRYYKYSQ